MDRIVVVFVTVIVAAVLVAAASLFLSSLGKRSVTSVGLVGLVLYGAFLAVKPDGWLLTDIVVLSSAAMIGSGLGLFIASKASLIAFVIAASVVDVVSATRGVTEKLVEGYRDGTSELLNYLVISIPWQGEIIPVVGIGDFFILVAIVFALARLGYKGPLAILAPLAGLLIALSVGLATGGIFAIPFIAGTTIVLVSLPVSGATAVD